MPIALFNLRIEIEFKKQRLILLAERHGRTSQKFLDLNGELDGLIVEYQRGIMA